MTVTVDTRELEEKVKRMYRAVATEPGGEYHFELGRPLAERLGYPAEVLDRDPRPGDRVVRRRRLLLRSSRAARPARLWWTSAAAPGWTSSSRPAQVGAAGRVVGVDFTPEQLAKASRLAAEGGFDQVEFREGRIERVPADDESADCVISNGVINLSPEKQRGVRRGGARAAPRRTPRDRRHRQRAAN